MENANGEVAYDWKEENGLLVAEEDGETISGGRENFQDEADEALGNITEALPIVEGDVVYLQAGTLEPGKAPAKLVVFGESAQAIAGALDAANVTYRDNFDSIDEKMEEGKETRDGDPYDESHYKVTISGKKNVQAAIQALVGDNGDYGAAVLQDEGGSIRILLNPKSVDMEGVTTLAQAQAANEQLKQGIEERNRQAIAAWEARTGLKYDPEWREHVLRPDGPFREVDGSTIREGTIRNGEWNGEVREYKDGVLRKISNYKNGWESLARKLYREDGTLALDRSLNEDGNIVDIHYGEDGKTEDYRLVLDRHRKVLFDSRQQAEEKQEAGAEGEGDLAGLAGNTALSVGLREQYNPGGWGDLGRKVKVIGDGKPFYKRPMPAGKRKSQIKDIKEEVTTLAFENVSKQSNVVRRKLDGDKEERTFLAIDGVLHQIAKGRLLHSANSADEATIDAVTRIGDLFNASIEVPGDFGDVHYRIAAMRLDEPYFVLFTERDLGGKLEVRDVQILKSVKAKKAGAPTQVVTPREQPANTTSVANLKDAWETLFLDGMEQHLKQKEAKPGNTALSVGGFGLNANARAEMEKVRKQYEGTDQWMKAPNGKPTKLNERQWLLVRTPSFKAWFGDWENDPANASKVVDENGEPLVVFHGSKTAGFTVFNKDLGEIHSDAPDSTYWFAQFLADARTYSGSNELVKLRFDSLEEALKRDALVEEWHVVDEDGLSPRTGAEIFDDKERARRVADEINEDFEDKPYRAVKMWRNVEDNGWEGDAVFTTPEAALAYANDHIAETQHYPANYPVFLNLRNPMVRDFEGYNWNGVGDSESHFGLWLNEESTFAEDGDGNPIHFYDEAEAADYAAELGLAEGDFEVQPLALPSTNDLARDALESGLYDGLIIRNVVDDGGEWAGAGTGTDYVVFAPNAIKSATDNTGNFDPENPDIRLSVGERMGGRAPIVEPGGDVREAGEGALAWLRRKFVHSQTPVFDAVRRVMGVGREPPDALNVEAAAKNVHGKIRARQEMLQRAYLEPLKAILAQPGMDRKRFDDYALALHALERNRMIQERSVVVDPTTGEIVDLGVEAGSGVTNAWAERVIREIQRDPFAAQYKEAAQILAEMNRFVLRGAVADGLLTEAQAKTWMRLSPHYVPLILGRLRAGYRRQDAPGEAWKFGGLEVWLWRPVLVVLLVLFVLPRV